MKNSYHLLILEDNRIDADLLQRMIKKSHPKATCFWAKNKDEYLQYLKDEPIDCVVSDYSLPAYDGVNALTDLQAMNLDIPFIIVSGTLGDERAVQIVRMGAFDFVLKDKLKRLPIAIENGLNEAQEKLEKLKARQELEMTVKQLAKSNEELAQFAYVASHDMKTPISNLMRLMELLQDLGGIKVHCQEIFDKTQLSVKRMDKTIRTLNKVLQLKQNHDRVEKSLLDFEQVFEDVQSNFAFQIMDTEAIIKTNFHKQPQIHIGRIHLESVFHNLLSNALKYRMPSRIPVINVSTDCIQDNLRLSFSDNGEGIDLDSYRNKLFGLFQRFNLEIEGTGVGLHMVKSIVENSGGYIEVESQLSEGTTFHLYFPRSLTAISQQEDAVLYA